MCSEIARALVGSGAKVVILDINPDQAEKAIEKIKVEKGEISYTKLLKSKNLFYTGILK